MEKIFKYDFSAGLSDIHDTSRVEGGRKFALVPNMLCVFSKGKMKLIRF